MKKLTQDDFNYTPSWAKSAAVDRNGKGYCFAVSKNELIIQGGEWIPPMVGDYFGKCDRLGFSWSLFDTTDWQNSAIDREVKK